MIQRFLYPATTPRTMLVAGALMAAGADAAAISRREDGLVASCPFIGLRLRPLTILDHRAAYVAADEILKKFGLTEAGTSAVVSLPAGLKR